MPLLHRKIEVGVLGGSFLKTNLFVGASSSVLRSAREEKGGVHQGTIINNEKNGLIDYFLFLKRKQDSKEMGAIKMLRTTVVESARVPFKDSLSLRQFERSSEKSSKKVRSAAVTIKLKVSQLKTPVSKKCPVLIFLYLALSNSSFSSGRGFGNRRDDFDLAKWPPLFPAKVRPSL